MNSNALRLRPILLGALGLLLFFAPARAQSPTDRSSALQQLEAILDLIDQHYVFHPGKDSLILTARDALLAALDPYSHYLDATEYEDLLRSISGSFGGVGVRIDQDSSQQFSIRGAYAGSPALNAGLRPKDVILTVDGQSTAGREFWEVPGWMRGPAGSTVVLTIRRPGISDELRFSMQRAVIEAPSVRGIRPASEGRWDYLVDHTSRIAFIRIASYTATTTAELDTALVAAGRAGADALVLDLRDNGGGLMRAAVEMADQFLDSGTIVTLRSATGDTAHVARTGVSATVPLAILINENTASAAELFASSLQDHHRAIVLGTRSYGKGRVQELFPLGEGKGALRISTSTYHRPSERSLERHTAGQDSTVGGVWPDSALAIPVIGEEYDRWATANRALDESMGFAPGQWVPPPPPPDRVLRRAVAALRRAIHR